MPDKTPARDALAELLAMDIAARYCCQCPTDYDEPVHIAACGAPIAAAELYAMLLARGVRLPAEPATLDRATAARLAWLWAYEVDAYRGWDGTPERVQALMARGDALARALGAAHGLALPDFPDPSVEPGPVGNSVAHANHARLPTVPAPSDGERERQTCPKCGTRAALPQVGCTESVATRADVEHWLAEGLCNEPGETACHDCQELASEAIAALLRQPGAPKEPSDANAAKFQTLVNDWANARGRDRRAEWAALFAFVFGGARPAPQGGT